MRRQLFVLLGITGLLVALPATAYAADTRLGQKILPINCVFEEVNDGLGSLYYLTPQECGAITSPSQNVQPAGPSDPVYASEPAYNPTRSLADSLTVRAVLPWQPIVAVVQGDGTVAVQSRPSSHQTGGANPLHAVGRLLSTTTAKVTVGVTASVFMLVVLVLALI